RVHLHRISGEEETAYHDQHLTLRDGRFITKHIYAGQTRIASKMDPDWFRDPPTIYYHPDHLGSTSFASNNEQTLTQRDEYFPTGELWIDASDSRYELRRAYVFTGKELDQATGLYYFGARYYDPRMSAWLSPDPILDEYMQGGPGGGVFNPGNLGLYSYTLNTPVNLVDPDGRNSQGAHRNFPPGMNGCRHPSCFSGPEGAKFHQEQMLQRMNAGSAAAATGGASRGIGNVMRRMLFRWTAQPQQGARPPVQPTVAPSQPPQVAQPAKPPQPAQAAKPPQPAQTGQAATKQPASSTGSAKGGPTRPLPELKVDSVQFGKKVGKHAKDFGLDAGNPAHRQWVRERINTVVQQHDEVRQGPWNPQGGGGNDFLFFRKGTDLVVTKSSGEFVTIFPGGQSNEWFRGASPR
ncbi:MAG TPA: RHS repeat-associated core domain-containing protein, partial [Sorangium sp.]|nr:RHS repeat-associated core domain-containing protein [Sorangium sp.]